MSRTISECCGKNKMEGRATAFTTLFETMTTISSFQQYGESYEGHEDDEEDNSKWLPFWSKQFRLQTIAVHKLSQASWRVLITQLLHLHPALGRADR